MLQPGKMAEIADELMNYKANICSLQEIRWKESGEIKKRAYSIFYSGSEMQGSRGTGFFVDNKTRRSLLSFLPISDRLCYLKLKGKFQNISIINVYAPTEDSTDTVKDQFYYDLEILLSRMHKFDVLIVMGDFNAQIGKESNIIQGVAGKFSLHADTNDNGSRLCDFAASQGLFISSTAFKHKRIHLETWKMPGNIRANQIDHILIDKRHATSIIDVRSYRGACCDTDHYLVISKLRQRVSKVNDSKGHRKIKWNTQEMHKNEITKKKYRESLETNINNNVNGPNERSEVSIDEHWNELKNLIINTAKDTIGERRSETNEWYDDDCRKANNIKQQARKAYVERCSRANFLEYQNKNKKDNKNKEKNIYETTD